MLTSAGAGQRLLSLVTSRPPGFGGPRPPAGLRMVGEQLPPLAEFAGPRRACLCSGAQQPNNSLCSWGHVASHVRGAVSAGVLAHLFSALSGLSGAGPSPRRQPAPWPEITSTNLPGRSGVALLLCRLAMCFSLQGVPQEKTFPVFGSRWAAPTRCTGRGRACTRRAGLGEGLRRAAPPSPSTSTATSPQHNHTRAHTVGVIHSVPRLL